MRVDLVFFQAQHAGAGRGADDLGQLLHGVHHAGGAKIIFYSRNFWDKLLIPIILLFLIPVSV